MKDFIAKLNQLKQKFSDGCGCRSLCLNAAPAVAPVRIPVTQLIFRPFGIFADRFGLLLRLAALLPYRLRCYRFLWVFLTSVLPIIEALIFSVLLRRGGIWFICLSKFF